MPGKCLKMLPLTSELLFYTRDWFDVEVVYCTVYVVSCKHQLLVICVATTSNKCNRLNM